MSLSPYLAADWDGDGVYEDALRATSITVSRGVDPLTGQLRVGTAQITLKNHDGRYSPYYASGALYPDVVPGKGVRFSSSWFPANWYHFAGHIREISANPAKNARSATFDCVDLLERLRRTKVNTGLLANKRSDELIDELLTLAGYSGSANLETGARVFPYALFEDVDCLTAIQQVITSEIGSFFVDGEGVPTFHARYHRYNRAVDYTLDDNFDALNFRLSSDTIYNVVNVTVYPFVTRTSGVIWEWGEVPFALQPGQTVTVDVVYRDETTGKDCWADDVLQPVIYTDYRAYQNADGTGLNLSAQLTLASWSANAKKASFTLSHALNYTIYVTRMQVRGVAIVKLDPVTVSAENSASIAAYGRNPLTLDLPFEGDTNEAQSIANYYANLYGNGVPTLRLGLMRGNDDRELALGGLELDMRVDVTNAILGLSASTFYVDAIDVSMGDHAVSFRADYTLTGLPADTAFLVLNDAGQTFADLMAA